MGINPIFTFILCFVPRILMGFLVGIIFRAIHKMDKTGFISFSVASLSAAALNTAFFVLGFFLLFRNAILTLGEIVIDVSTMNILDVLVFIAGINGVIEIIVCTILSTALGKIFVHLQNKYTT